MKTIAFDTETWLIEPGRIAPRLVCLSYCDGGPPVLLARDDAIAWAADVLADPEVLLVGHNVAYDLAVLAQADPAILPLIWAAYDADRIADTMTHEALRKIALGRTKTDPEQDNKRPRYTLAALVEQYFGENVEGKSSDDAWRLRYHELDGVPLDRWPEAARSYALLDAQYTYRVWTRQATNPQWDFFPQVRYAWALHLLSAWGIRTDKAAVDALERALTDEIAKAKGGLIESGVLRASGSKDIAAIRARVEAVYGDAVARTAKGAVSTARDVLEESGDPVLVDLAAIGADEKILSTYIPALRGGTERPINSRYRLVDSGRTSASGPNIQNLPRKGGVRECFVPRPGMIFVAADYSVAELCSLAQVLLDRYGQSAMAEALQAGRELHLAVAAQIVGCSYEEAVERHAAGDADVKAARQLAKAANFGYPGGLGPTGLCGFAKAAYGIDLSEEAATKLREDWFSTYPEMRRYFADIGRDAGNGSGFTATHHRSKRKRGGLGFTNGCNTYFQGLAADMAKSAVYDVMREIHTKLDSPLSGCHPVAFIHDEILMEAPEDRAAEAAQRLSALMVEAGRYWLPDIPIKAEAHLMRRWYKDAEPAHDEAGRLIPWEPKKK